MGTLSGCRATGCRKSPYGRRSGFVDSTRSTSQTHRSDHTCGGRMIVWIHLTTALSGGAMSTTPPPAEGIAAERYL